MNKKTTIVFLSSLLLCAGGGFAGSFFHLPLAYGMSLAVTLCETSSLLFGVFGIWLGVSYKSDIESLTDGKSGDELRRTAEEVVTMAERCKVLFRGLAVSTVVFFVSLLLRVVCPLLSCIPLPVVARISLKGVFFTIVLWGVSGQLYSLFSTVAVMLDAYKRADKAGRDAQRILSRFPRRR